MLQRTRPGVLAGIACGATLLATTAACAENGGPGGASAGDGGTGKSRSTARIVSTLKVCGMADLQPLLRLLGGPYQSGPSDIPKGVGVDPPGPQCSAMIKLAALADTAPVPARLNISVVGHDGPAQADRDFDARVADARSRGGSANPSANLAGPWARGVYVTGNGVADRLVYVLVQRDDYLVKLDLIYGSDRNSRKKFRFTETQMKAAVTEVVKTVYSAAETKIPR